MWPSSGSVSGARVGPGCPSPRPRPCRHPPVSAAEFSSLKQEQDADCRRFYRSYLEDVVKLSQYVVAC